MPFFEDRVLTDTIEIKTTPEKIFSFLTSIVDDDSYRAWHPKDLACSLPQEHTGSAGSERLFLMQPLKRAYRALNSI